MVLTAGIGSLASFAIGRMQLGQLIGEAALLTYMGIEVAPSGKSVIMGCPDNFVRSFPCLIHRPSLSRFPSSTEISNEITAG
jgi:hypothetical protein